MNQSTGKRTIELLIKSTLVCVLLYFLARKGIISVSMQDTKRALTQWDRIIPAFSMLLFSALLGVVRWQWLLQAQGIDLKWMRTLELSFVGNFFNIALPGAVSGDFVKAFYIGKEIEGKRARAFGSILFDRVSGLSALVMVSAVALMSGFESFWGTPLFMAIQLVITIAALSAVLFFAYLFFVREDYDPLLIFFRKMEKKIKMAESFTRIYEGIRHYHNHRWIVMKVLIISALIHILIGLSLYELVQALGETQVSTLALYVVFPIGLLITAIPVMPAGIGTGHVAFAYLFRLIGSQKGADLFTLFAVFNLLLGAIGGLVYLRFRGGMGLAEVSSPNGDSVRA